MYQTIGAVLDLRRRKIRYGMLILFNGMSYAMEEVERDSHPAGS